MHPAVRRVIPVKLRRWRTALVARLDLAEIGAFREALRAERYDAIVDTQSLLKSALLAQLRARRAPRHGRRQRARAAGGALLRPASRRAAWHCTPSSATGSSARRRSAMRLRHRRTTASGRAGPG